MREGDKIVFTEPPYILYGSFVLTLLVVGSGLLALWSAIRKGFDPDELVIAAGLLALGSWAVSRVVVARQRARRTQKLKVDSR